MTTRITVTTKIREHFRRYPTANVKDAAQKFNQPVSRIYKLRKEVQEANVAAAQRTDDIPLRIEMLDGPQDAGVTWTAPSTEAEPSGGEIEQVLRERGDRYGPFENHAKITQMLKDVMRSEPGWGRLTYPQREALEMVAHKIGRMLNGDPDYDDSWVDIAGYAKLVADRL